MDYRVQLPFYASAYSKHGAICAILNQDRKVLLNLRDNIPGISYPNYWTLIGGHVDPGESAREAAFREVWEEVGLSLTQLTWHNSLPNPRNGALDQVFVAIVDMDNSDIICNEGQGSGFFTREEVAGMLVVPHNRVILDRLFDLGVPQIAQRTTPVIDFPDFAR